MISVWVHSKLKVLILLYNLQLAELLFLPLHQIADLQYKWTPCFSVPPFIAFSYFILPSMNIYLYIYLSHVCSTGPEQEMSV